MKLGDLVTTADAWAAITPAFAQVGRGTPLQAAQSIARDAVKRAAVGKLTELVKSNVQDMYDMHVMVHGECDPSWRTFQKAAWSEDLETQFEELFDNDPVLSVITSSNFKGTVDAITPLDQAGVDAFLTRFADDAWRCLTAHNDKDNKEMLGTEKSAGQILSSVGIVTPDIEALLVAAPEQQPQTQEFEMIDMNALLSEIRESADMLGIMANPKQFADTIDNASDDDVILSQSAFGMLGLEWTADKHNALTMERMTQGVEGIIQCAYNGTVGAPVSQPAAVAETPVAQPSQPAETVTEVPAKQTRQRKKQEPTGPNAAGLIPASVLATLKDKTGVKAEDLGAGVGASRTTFLNYAAGKAQLYATEASKTFIMNVLDDHINALETAKMMLESVEVTR